MLAVTLTLSSIISILFLCVGGIIGYLLKEYVYERNSTYIPTHPEMFDENGNMLMDDLIYIRPDTQYWDPQFESDDDD